MTSVNPLDINRIKNTLGLDIKSIESLKTENYMVRVYNVNNNHIVTINNLTNEVIELMG